MVSILISTIYDRIDLLNEKNYPQNPEVTYFISCQGYRNKEIRHYEEALISIFGKNCNYSFMEGYGLSKNRNNAITLALSKSNNDTYFYICDDDISIDIDSLLKVSAIASHEKLVCVVGMVKTINGYFKNYPAKQRTYSRLDCSKVSSVEMLVCSDFIEKNKLHFDERFGLGAEYPSGEEFVFCNDIISLGGKVRFFPIAFCEHPPVSSGSDFFSSHNKVIAKGAMFTRVFGKVGGVVLSLIFAFKKKSQYRGSLTFFEFTKQIIKGALR
ncbi:glycosyl transferase [Pseudoalteromonas sp. MM1]|uniref:hypothetical protein n=1 Tax=Pseudoalteromonas sp. MM1 TaxID=3036714 RepID=UPI002573BABE|nr:hypothetical protein [Pseudoalteromonas sp. MM1]BED88002.1 glycosyl transferase [Pseudoalteromonas sp. MM1]